MSVLSCDWLLKWARWSVSCPHGITWCVLEGKSVLFHIRNLVLTSLFGQDGLILATIVFCVGVHTSTLSWCIKKELRQYPAIFTPCLVNKPVASLRLYHFSLIQGGNLYIEFKQGEFSKIEWDKFCWTVVS